MSDLSNFCNAILDEVDPSRQSFKVKVLRFFGIRKHPWFSLQSGLCSNAWRYNKSRLNISSVYIDLDRLFKGELYPFNTGGIQFGRESADNTLYKNEKRLAFLREHAKTDTE